MKYTTYCLFILFLLLSSPHIQAQESSENVSYEKSKFIGGSFYIRMTSSESLSQLAQYGRTTISTQPYFGIDINESFSIGGLLNYWLSRNKTTGEAVSETSIVESFGGGLLSRIHLKNGKLGVFLQSQIIYSLDLSRSKSTDTRREQSDSKLNALSVQLSPTMSYQLNRIRLLASLGGLSYYTKGEETDRNTKDIVRRSSSEWVLDIRPRSLRFGAEFLFWST